MQDTEGPCHVRDVYVIAVAERGEDGLQARAQPQRLHQLIDKQFVLTIGEGGEEGLCNNNVFVEIKCSL